MAYFIVDKTKCKGDGTCVADCPIKILEMDDKSHIPFMINKGEEICIKCGHCVAVCPHGAISLEIMRKEDCAMLKSGWRIPQDKVEQFLKGRRSVRIYNDQAVDKVTLEKLIDIARFAPSGVNRQPVYWAVLSNKEKVRGFSEIVINWMRSLIAGSSPLTESFRMKNIVTAWDKKQDWTCRGAPHLIIAYGLKDDITAPQACTIALTYLELTVVSFGLGSCWAGYAAMAINMSAEARKFVGLSSKTNCFGAMMIGYSKFNYSRIPLRNKPHILWR